MATAPQEINESFPAEPGAVPLARRRVAEFAAWAGADQRRLEAVRLACSEALTNVVLHAYRDAPGQMHVTAAVAEDDLWVLVGDDGYGLHAQADRPGLGLGLALIAQLSDEMCIQARSGGGTEVRMRFALVRSHDGQVNADGAGRRRRTAVV